MTRPDYRHQTPPLARVIRATCVALTIAASTLLAVRYPTLEPRVPVHFSAVGDPDNYGPRWAALVMMVVFLLLIAGIAWLSVRLHLFNYPMEITDRNAPTAYRAGQTMMLGVLAGVSVVHIGIVVFFLTETGEAFMMTGMAMMVLATISGIIMMTRPQRSHVTD